MFIKKNIIRKISILLFSIFILLFAFEYILSTNNNYIELQKEERFGYQEKDAINITRVVYISEKGKNSLDGELYGDDISFDENKYDVIFDGKYMCYNNGFRYTQCNHNSKDVYVFLGCSFTYGDGCNDTETLPYYFSKKFNFDKNIINCGIPGRSTNSAINILKNEVFCKLLNPDSNIRYFFYSVIEEQFYRNFSISDSHDYYLYDKNKFSTVDIPFRKIKYFFINSFIFRKVFLRKIEGCNYRYYEDYMVKSLEEINRIVQEKYNSKLVVILWNKNYKEYSEYFLTKIKNTDLDLIFLPDKFNVQDDKYKSSYDLHPRYKANEEIAEILYDHINNLN